MAYFWIYMACGWCVFPTFLAEPYRHPEDGSSTLPRKILLPHGVETLKKTVN